jgi:hypothetical protein
MRYVLMMWDEAVQTLSVGKLEIKVNPRDALIINQNLEDEVADEDEKTSTFSPSKKENEEEQTDSYSFLDQLRAK